MDEVTAKNEKSMAALAKLVQEMENEEWHHLGAKELQWKVYAWLVGFVQPS